MVRFMSLKIDVVSGFLGAGKTTMIKKLLDEEVLGQDIAIIENEFGDIDIDSGRLGESGIQIKSISSGCICCTLAGEFDLAIKDLIKEYNPKRIIIEPTGIGKLSDILSIINKVKISENVKSNIAMTIVDPNDFGDFIELFGDFFINQIQHATTIVLSKTQLVEEAKVNKVISSIREINPHGNIIATPWDKLEAKHILDFAELGKGSIEFNEFCDSCHHHYEHQDHDGIQEKFEFWSLETMKKYDEPKLKVVLDELNKDKYGKIFRAKGTLLNIEGQWIDFDFVPRKVNIIKGKIKLIGQIIIIGRELNRDALKDLFS